MVPFFLESVLGNLALMQADRVHPNAAGARVIADRVWPYSVRRYHVSDN
jgi:acyl-CoA thioesterase-1